MRSYPTNSPEAAARLLAMALVADGQYSMTEIKTIERLQASQRLGLAPEAIKSVIDVFCEDLLLGAGAQWTGSANMEESTRTQLLAEVQDPKLQETVWQLCEAIALSDGHLADGEVDLLDRMAFAWRHPSMAVAHAT